MNDDDVWAVYEDVIWPTQFCDVVFEFPIAPDKVATVRSHAVVLAGRSRVFAQMFESGMIECASKPFKIRIVDHDMQTFICFLITLYDAGQIIVSRLPPAIQLCSFANAIALGQKYLCAPEYFSTLWNALNALQKSIVIMSNASDYMALFATAVDCTKRMHDVCKEIRLPKKWWWQDFTETLAGLEDSRNKTLLLRLNMLAVITEHNSLLQDSNE